MSRKNLENQVSARSCCFCVECSPFFWKNLDSKSATNLLAKRPIGSFLLRPSQHPLYEYTLSQKDRERGVTHIRIGRDSSGLYLMDTDESASNLNIRRFACVVNMVESWTRVYSEIGKRCLLTPVSNTTNSTPSYINDDCGCVCFHDDEEADRSFREFFSAIVGRNT